MLEAEANIFVSELLAPSEVLLHCNCTSKSSIIKLCGLSKEAADHKEAYLSKYKSRDVDENINEASTGEVLDGWSYVLNCIKDDMHSPLYYLLKGTIAKIDYDTLYIFTDNMEIIDALDIQANIDHLLKLSDKKLGISIFEIIAREIDYTISYPFQAISKSDPICYNILLLAIFFSLHPRLFAQVRYPSLSSLSSLS